METAHAPTNYRSWLSKELMRRIRANPAYSLRRYAQQLGVSPSTMSGILSGQRKLTLKAAGRIIERLDLAPAEAQKFLNLITSAHVAGSGAAATPEFMQLASEAFEVIAEWYHYAILELTFVPGCKSDPQWIAKKLGITPIEASQAMNRLVELGLLEIQNGKPKKTTAHLTTTDGVASSALRRRHKQILAKAADSIEQHSLEERDFSTITMAIDPELLPEAKARIAAFRRELCAFLESGKSKRVYELSIQLFPLSERETKN